MSAVGASRPRSCETRMHMDEAGRYVVRPIDVVRSRLRAIADAPSQAFERAPEALLEIDSALADALHRLEPGDELIVLTWLHLADRDVLQAHPMGDERILLTGVFRTPSPNRPNPIGLAPPSDRHCTRGRNHPAGRGAGGNRRHADNRPQDRDERIAGRVSTQVAQEIADATGAV